MTKRDVFEELLQDWSNLTEAVEAEFAKGISPAELDRRVKEWQIKYEEAEG